jgi:alpha-glucosidase
MHGPGEHPHLDRDELHEIYRSWRAVADSYDDPRILVGEVWLPDAERFAKYLRPDEMHSAFNFDFMVRPWDAASLRDSIDTTLAAHAPVGAPATWVLSNHDVTRPVTRYGRADSSFDFTKKRFGTPSDLALGTRRARAAALLTGALPGALYVYQGDELGLPEVEDLPLDVLEDPMHFRSGGVDPGRDGCRVPLPWTRDGSSYGFGAGGSWLPQPPWWGDYAVAVQEGDPASMLTLYRTMLRLRRSLPDLAGRGLVNRDLTWFADDEAAPGVLAFRRGARFACVVNLGGLPAAPPAGEVMLASGPLGAGGTIPPDTGVWLRLH